MKNYIKKLLGITKLEVEVAEFTDVLTDEDGKYIGSEIDRKLDKKDFEKIVGKEKEVTMPFWGMSWFDTNYTKPTLFKRIEDLENKLSKLEKHLKIEYREETKEIKGYKPVSKKNAKA